MKKRYFAYAAIVGLFIISAICVSQLLTPPQPAPDVKTSEPTSKTDPLELRLKEIGETVSQQILSIEDAELDFTESVAEAQQECREYNARIKKHDVPRTIEELPTCPKPDVLRKMIARFWQDDFAPFVNAAWKHIPREHQARVRQRILTCTIPEQQLTFLGFLDFGHAHDETATIALNPVIGEPSYEIYRLTLVHECAHYFLEAVEGERTKDFLREGLTEFITLKLAEDLGWQTRLTSYKDEVCCVSLLVPIAGEQLLTYYFSGSAEMAEQLTPLAQTISSKTGMKIEVAVGHAIHWSDLSMDFYHDVQDKANTIVSVLDLTGKEQKMIDLMEAVQFSALKFKYTVKELEDLYTNTATAADPLVLPLPKDKADVVQYLFSSIEEDIKPGQDPEENTNYRPFFIDALPVVKHVIFGTALPAELTPLQKGLAPEKQVTNLDEFKQFFEKLNALVKQDAAKIKALSQQLKQTSEAYKAQQAGLIKKHEEGRETALAKARQPRLAESLRLTSSLDAVGFDWQEAIAKHSVPAVIKNALHTAAE